MMDYPENRQKPPETPGNPQKPAEEVCGGSIFFLFIFFLRKKSVYKNPSLTDHTVYNA